MADLRATHSAVAQTRGYAEALLFVAGSTLLGLDLTPRWGNSAVDLLYLPAVLATAVLGGLWPALFAALLAALAYNFFFTAPHMTFRIDNPNDLVTVVVLFAVAVVTSQLAASVRKQARLAEAHAARDAAIAGLARRLLSCTSEQEVADVSAKEFADLFDCNAVLLTGAPEPRLAASAPAGMRLTAGDLAVAALVIETGNKAGRGLDRAIPTEWQFHAVKSGSAAIATMGLARDDGAPAVEGKLFALLDNLLDQVALALERGRLENEAQEVARDRERNRVRSVLLSTIGEDLRPGLKAITSAVAALTRSGEANRETLSDIGSEARKLDRYVSNLVEMGPAAEERILQLDGVTVDLFRRAVTRDGEEIHLTPKEYAVLAELAKHPGQVLTHSHLLRTAWGPAHETQIDYLRVAVRALRQKLERDPARPNLIVNEPAVGYRLSSS
jgi:two-component system, OmpR family, sensor histidine kinase KdpD